MENKKYLYTGNFSEEERIENDFEEDFYSFELDVGILRESGRNNTIYITKSNRSVGWRFRGTKLDITPYIQHLIDKGLVIEEMVNHEEAREYLHVVEIGIGTALDIAIKELKKYITSCEETENKYKQLDRDVKRLLELYYCSEEDERYQEYIDLFDKLLKVGEKT